MSCARFRPASIFAAVIFVWQAVAGAQPMPWLPSFQTALDQLKQGDLSQALAAFNSLWKSYRGDVRLATSIGGVLDVTVHHNEATVWYERALAIQPDFPPALEDLAMNYAVRGKLSEAATVLRKVVQRDPANGKAGYQLGTLLLRLGRYEEAAAILKTVDTAATKPPLEQIYIAEATAAFHLAHYAETIALLRKCGMPRSLSTFQLLGSALALSGDLPTAISTFQQAIAAYPKDPNLYFRLTMVFAEGRRDNEAEAVLQEASKQNPNSPLIAYGHAVLLEMMGRDEEAIVCAKKSLSVAQRQPEVWGLLGTLYDHTGASGKAIEAYQKALAYGGNGAYSGTKYAELLIRLQHYPEAANELTALQSTSPDDARVSRALGKLYRAEGKEQQAETALRRAIRLDGSDPQSHYALAQILRRQGNAKEEAEQLRAFQRSREKAESVRLLELVGNPAP